MKKFFLLATTALMVTGVAFADGGKKNKKKCAKEKSCGMEAKASCSKDAKAKKAGCCKDKAVTTASM